MVETTTLIIRFTGRQPRLSAAVDSFLHDNSGRGGYLIPASFYKRLPDFKVSVAPKH